MTDQKRIRCVMCQCGSSPSSKRSNRFCRRNCFWSRVGDSGNWHQTHPALPLEEIETRARSPTKCWALINMLNEIVAEFFPTVVQYNLATLQRKFVASINTCKNFTHFFFSIEKLLDDVCWQVIKFFSGSNRNVLTRKVFEWVSDEALVERGRTGIERIDVWIVVEWIRNITIEKILFLKNYESIFENLVWNESKSITDLLPTTVYEEVLQSNGLFPDRLRLYCFIQTNVVKQISWFLLVRLKPKTNP